mgnify:CR=1 FL=1
MAKKGCVTAVIVLGVAILVLSPVSVVAQTVEIKPHRQYSVGVLVGRISGLTAKIRYLDLEERLLQTTPSVDVNLTTNFDDNVLWSAHVLREGFIQDSPLKLFIGPGLTAGWRDQDPFWGISGTVGVSFKKGPYEIFLQGMPRLYLMPNMDGRMEAATGIRIDF